MSLKGRATFGAVALCLGLLLVVGASVSKSTTILKYERDVARGVPEAAPPETGGRTFVMVLGWIFAAGGAVVVGLALRDMTRQIGDIQSRAEAQMRMEAAAKRDPKR